MSLPQGKNVLRGKQETRIPLDKGERSNLLSDLRKSKKKTFRGLMAEMRHKTSYFPQPVRVQPDIELFREHPEWSVSKKMAKATAREIKEWGPKVVADIKTDGVRGFLYVNPKKKEVRLYSRRMKPLHKLEKKYTDAILENVSKFVKDETVFDTEIYATGPKGKLLEYGIVAGWARNPTNKKYDDLLPTIEVFDVMLINQRDVRKMPLKYRKRLLESLLKKYDGKVLDIADTRLMKNHPRPIEWRFKAIIKGKGEGLVLKDPDGPYYYGKKGIKDKGWAKLKAGDTLDLEMKAIGSSPYGQAFKDYRHWIMVPSDDEAHEIRANKGIKAATYNDEFYRNFSLDMVNQWKRGKLKGTEKMIKVDKELVDFYGVKQVPEKLIYPTKKRMIVEIFTEKITKNLQPSGQKIVGIREDKLIGDKKRDIEKLRKFLLAIKEE
jgi:ATP-dependent DNA ligase